MQHPRTQIRHEIRDALAALSDMPDVHASRARDLKKGETSAVLIYTPSESLRRPPGGGEGRPGTPILREINVEIVVMCRAPGDGDGASDAADALARRIEIELNGRFPDLRPTSCDCGVHAADTAQAIVTLSYAISLTDTLS